MLSFEVLLPTSRLSSSHLFHATQGVVEVEGPFEALPWAEFWSSGKRQPYLIRNAFDPDDDATYDAWPTFDDIFLELSTTDQTRLIHHSPGNLSSFQVEPGPLEKAADDLVKPMESSNREWTILVNDVDRYVPELADWIDSYFASWLPRWRRDDAQMSIAKTGGGIGPHVDNYDVFLVQTSGERQWKVSNEILSAVNETDLLIPNIPVSILNVTDLEASKTLTEVLLKRGDCLYLPPRVIHWGTAASDDCVTLSIGCLAPSAADLLTRASEHVITRGALHPTAVHRYNDAGSERKGESATLSMTTKEDMKLMVRRAIDAVLDDDELWDTIVGRLTTEPVRYGAASDILVPYKDENKEYRERWGATAQAALDKVREAGATAALIRNPGISLATSTLQAASLPSTTEEESLPPPLSPRRDRLWACGQMWELADCNEAATAFRTVERGDLLDGDVIKSFPNSLQSLLCTLLEEGVLQVCDLLDPSEEGEDEDHTYSALEP